MAGPNSFNGVFYTPCLIVKNITSNKDVRVLEVATLKPGETADIFKMVTLYGLTEDEIMYHLSAPHGDLYKEVFLKGSLQILSLDLPSFHYSLVDPSNIVIEGDFVPGSWPVAVDETTFKWVKPENPLIINGDSLSIPPASSLVDGYLTKEDYALLFSGLGDQVIWQYQDFSAGVGASLTLNSFENGTGLAFDSAYIVDDSAVIVLVSNNEQPPTTTTTIPFKWLPGNRVDVDSHIATNVVLNQVPAGTLPVRVFYQINLPAGVKYPSGYVESPHFVNEKELDFMDEFFMNQAGDETIYDVKTFVDQAVFESGINIPVGPIAGYVLTTDASGNASWQFGGGGGGGGTLGSLSDVDLSTVLPNVGDHLGFDGYNWIPLESGDTMYNKEIDEVSGGDLYVGESIPGTGLGEAKWRIKFIDFTKTGGLEDISISWAGGDALFDKVWDDRLTYIYS